jgi:hypothetical protein
MLPSNSNDMLYHKQIEFTRIPDPTSYGRIVDIKASDGTPPAGDQSFRVCSRKGIFALHIQERIVRFLCACAKFILPDISRETIMASPVAEEPLMSNLIDAKQGSESSFSSGLMTAPYRGWHRRNFAKLRGHVTATLDKQKEHLWLLHEDPDYMADTLREYEDHVHPSVKVNLSTIPGKRAFQTHIVRCMAMESYCTLARWDELDRRFSDCDKIFEDDDSIHDQIHAIGAVERIAKGLQTYLASELAVATRTAPNIRNLVKFTHDASTKMTKIKGRDNLSATQTQLMHIYEEFADLDSILKRPVALSFLLESIDLVLRSHSDCQTMVSARVLSLLTDLSIVADCLVQIKLWRMSPAVQTCRHEDCNYQLDLPEYTQFMEWAYQVNQIPLAPQHLYPYQVKLYYPAHKRPTRDHIEAMRRAESNLDRFWGDFDLLVEKKTGHARHSVIHNCLAGAPHRTKPWDEPEISNKETPPSYEPFSNMDHDRALQVTGCFDKMSIEERTKTKTRGTPAPNAATAQNLAVEQPKSMPTSVRKTFKVDPRTHKVFKTIFYTSTMETGDLPKSIKWDEFKRAMTRLGFVVENMQGAAWQFTPGDANGADRNIQFHMPHPVSDLPYIMAKRFGRRLGRVYGWSADTFKLA